MPCPCSETKKVTVEFADGSKKQLSRQEAKIVVASTPGARIR
jgi:hypothetical protein